MPGDDSTKIQELYVRTSRGCRLPVEIAQWAQASYRHPLHPIRRRDKVIRQRRSKVTASRARHGERPANADTLRQPDPLRGLETRAANQRLDPRARAYEDMFWTLLNS